MSIKNELFDKMASIKAHTAGMLVLLHRLEEAPSIHFEIGLYKDGKSTLQYASKDMLKVLEMWHSSGMKQEEGFRIDVWQNEEPIADIDMSTGKEKTPKVLFEINKKVVIDRSVVNAPKYEYESVFRSVSAIDCRKEWKTRRYTQKDYVMDIREAPEGEESYHVADIDIDSMAKNYVPKKHDRGWLVDLIKAHNQLGKITGGTDIDAMLADKISAAYSKKHGRDEA
jgi:hypothetical protein